MDIARNAAEDNIEIQQAKDQRNYAIRVRNYLRRLYGGENRSASEEEEV
jgi:hypothetical protein